MILCKLTVESPIMQVPDGHPGPVRGHGLQPGLLPPRPLIKNKATIIVALEPLQGSYYLYPESVYPNHARSWIGGTRRT